MRRKYNYLFPLILSLMVIFGMLVGAKYKNDDQRTSNVNYNRVFEQVYNFIQTSYVDNPDDKVMIEAAIKSMLNELDPHSVFIPAEELKRMNQPLEGNFEGIGIEFNILNDTIVVVSPIAGGPSEALGIRAGDKIIKIDGEVVAGVGFTNQDVINTLRGEKGTKVTVSMLRRGEKELIDFTITRDKIPIFSVDAAYMVDDKIGYIKVNRFSATTIREMVEGMNELNNQGMESLILDLRGNPGGYLNAAIQMADQFLDRNKLVVYTEGRSRPRQTYNSSNRGHFKTGKLVVLIDEGSASASEIVSGAIQDWDRGLVIGRRSFGKGLVQEPFMLSDGSALRLTVARYYTPTGRSIQRPYDQGTDEYHRELMRRYNKGELSTSDSIHFPDSLKYFTPSKRVVYGGGGIMPDIFIPVDTADFSEYLNQLTRKGVINQFIMNYVDKNRVSLNSRYTDFDYFDRDFKITNSIMNEFVSFGESNDVKRDDEGLAISRDFIENRIKAGIARQVFDNQAFFKVANKIEPGFLKAVEVLKDDTFEKLNLSYR